MRRRPLPVTIIGWVYILAGAIGFAFHLPEFGTAGAFPGILWLELVRLLAVLAGVFILRGHNWARWLALAWIGFHVVVGALHTLPAFAVHVVFFAVTAWVLLRRAASDYFRCIPRPAHSNAAR